MAGFAAGVYLRGIRCVQLPTTLLAAVDSSVGGKTAVDLRAGKNLAGVFLQPSAVLCDTECLSTLPADVFADGAAEAIKTGVLCDEGLFDQFDADSLQGSLSDIIARCVAFKGSVVEQDEFDTGLRRTLNLGHTAGHAIEQCSGYTIPHGHAVAIGMSKLESCPVTGRNFEFIFFLESDASVQEPGVLPMLEELERSCAGFQFLGNYAEV